MKDYLTDRMKKNNPLDFRAKAEASAKQPVRRDGRPFVEELDPGCRADCTKMRLPEEEEHSRPRLKYAWQQAVVDAFDESKYRPEFLRLEVNAARRAISIRLCESTPFAREEQIAIRHALLSLRVLLAQSNKVSK